MMARISIDVPNEFLQQVGSEDAARNLLFGAAVSELLRRGMVSENTAESWLGESLADWLRLADHGGAFDFWHDPAEDIYTLDHGEPL